MNTMTLATDWSRLSGRFEDAIWTTLYMVSITMVVGGLIGLALGILLYTTRPQGVLRNKPVFTILNILVNLVQPILKGAIWTIPLETIIKSKPNMKRGATILKYLNSLIEIFMLSLLPFVGVHIVHDTTHQGGIVVLASLPR